MKSSKVAVAINSFAGSLLRIAGYSVGAILILALISGFADAYDGSYTNEALVLSGFLIALCAVLVAIGTRIKRRVHRFRQYVSLMSSQKLTSIADIAARTSRSMDFVQKDLQKMIRKRFFVNASIDMTTRKIIVCASTLPGQGGSMECEVFHCSGCGAAGTKAKGMLGHCDYCGSPIQ